MKKLLTSGEALAKLGLLEKVSKESCFSFDPERALLSLVLREEISIKQYQQYQDLIPHYPFMDSDKLAFRCYPPKKKDRDMKMPEFLSA